ncbi:SCP-like protein [Ancylostoma caninum]|uniref:SCP-like protein n=1 Tax=Ancylostoma caninum TaxID=29170 RepID=A0A368H6D1_ANCCA|nr:SCP-like protein [Ancylostoma caninum]
MLNHHNGRRELIIKGSEKDSVGDTLPKPENMYKVIYDCDLEEEARKIVTDCAPSFQKSASNGINFRHFNIASGDKPDDAEDPLVSAVVEWLFNGTARVWPQDNKYDGDDGFLAYANMMHSKKTRVGCYEAKCVDKASAACVYDQP